MFAIRSANLLWNLLHSRAVVADVVKTRGIKDALSVLIILDPYLVFFSVSFLSRSLSTGVDMFDGALGWVIGHP